MIFISKNLGPINNEYIKILSVVDFVGENEIKWKRIQTSRFSNSPNFEKSTRSIFLISNLVERIQWFFNTDPEKLDYEEKCSFEN